MGANLTNQSGTINLPYQISIKTKGDHVAVYLDVKLPGSDEFLCAGVITAGAVRTDGILEAMLRAEEKWGLDLIKYIPDNLKVK